MERYGSPRSPGGSGSAVQAGAGAAVPPHIPTGDTAATFTSAAFAATIAAAVEVVIEAVSVRETGGGGSGTSMRKSITAKAAALQAQMHMQAAALQETERLLRAEGDAAAFLVKYK
jgi:hypothetical protein